jgi:hypothetical protein
MFGLARGDGPLGFGSDRPRTFPAILWSTVVLRGQRAQISVDGRDARRALQAARRRHTGVVLLPALDGIARADIRVGTLVDIEDEIDGDRGTHAIEVFGRDAVSVRRIRPGSHLEVVADVRPHWTGDDPVCVAQVEAAGKRLKRRATIGSRMFSHKPRSYTGIGFDQLVVDLGGWVLRAESERARLLDENLLGQLDILDNVLRLRLKAVRKTERGHVRRRIGEAARRRPEEEQESEQELPPDVVRAIEEEKSRAGSGWGRDTSEEAVRFIKGMKWSAPPATRVDLARAQIELDAACFGLQSVKEYVLDFLASWEWARQRNGAAPPPGKVLCLVGPPGVGKTAIAAAITAAMRRQLIRMPMGGIDDVFLIGADQAYSRGRPGEIARRIREAGRHPSELVFLLDEIDKVADKSNSAVPVLLALLDREQQAHFRDHFLDAVTLDLASSVFICTANNLDDIAAPLRDRLQPLVLPAYGKDAQVMIGAMHLLPRLRQRLQITSDQVGVSDGVIKALVDGSAPSPGMRQLQGQLETVLTRGLRLYMETAEAVFVGIEEALQWSGSQRSGLRRIGFRTAAARDTAELRELRSAINGDEGGIMPAADRGPGVGSAARRIPE